MEITLLTYDEAAKRLGLSPRTLQGLVAKKGIPHRRIGNLVRFTPQDLEDYLSQCRQVPEPAVQAS